ncbi:MAG: hypothetical protein QOE60_1224, partial [Thermoleophilaceae bacterium]|nr:hypothetical protein [Thermoleophilaceae bacterium]
MTLRGRNLRGWAPALALLIPVVVVSALVIPRIQAHGSAT